MNGSMRFAVPVARPAFLSVLATVAVLTVAIATTVADEPPAQRDTNGDSLPSGAIARIGSSRLRHGSSVTGLNFSPDGRVLISGSNDRTIRLWDVTTGREKHALVGPTGRIRATALSPDGKWLAAATESAGIWVWNVATARVIHKITEVAGPIEDVAFSSDGKLLASSGKQAAIELWNVADGNSVAKLQEDGGGVMRLAFNADDAHLVSLNGAGSLTVWDYRKRKQVIQVPVSPKSMSLAISPDGLNALVGGSQGAIDIYSLKTGKRTRSFSGHTSRVLDMAFSRDGKTLVSAGADRTAQVWDWPFQKVRAVWKGHVGTVNRVAVSADGKVVASGGGTISWSVDNTIRLWNSYTGEELPQSNQFTGQVSSLAYSPDGKTLATGTDDKRVQLWNVKSGKLNDRWRIGGSKGSVRVAFTPDGKTLACAGQNDLFLTQVEDSDKTVTLGGVGVSTHSVAVSPDGKTLAAGDEIGTVQVWDLETRRARARHKNHGQSVLSVAFSPDSQMIASTAWDGVLCLRNVKTGNILLKQKLHQEYGRAVAFSPDGRLLASASDDKSVCLIEVDSGKEIARLMNPSGVTAIAFHPDCRTLITGHWSNQIHVWDTATGERIKRFHAPPGIATGALVCSADGRHFVAGLTDTSSVIWDLEPLLRQQVIARRALNERDGLQSPWTALASRDAAEAQQAYWELATSDQKVVQFLAKHLLPPPARPEALAQVADLIKLLDDAKFTVRERASIKLEEIGPQATALLEKALLETKSAEARGRLKRILSKTGIDGTVPFHEVELLRKARAVRLLGHLNTSDADALLKILADSSDPLLARRAKSALQLSNSTEPRDK